MRGLAYGTAAAQVPKAGAQVPLTQRSPQWASAAQAFGAQREPSDVEEQVKFAPQSASFAHPAGPHRCVAPHASPGAQSASAAQPATQ